MFENKNSGLKFYSIGIVAKDKVYGSLFIEVYPMEKIPTADGEIKTEEQNITAENENGKQHNVTVPVSNTVDAVWLSEGQPNRLTPPDVCAGETVKLYNSFGTDVYYWSTCFSELELRKREEVIFAVSNKDKADKDGWKNKTYFFIMSTLRKFFNLHTNNNDGEYTTYDIYLDTEAGRFTLKDGLGNQINLISPENTIYLNVNKDIVLQAGDTVSVKAKDFIVEGSSSAIVNGGNLAILEGSTAAVISGSESRGSNGVVNKSDMGSNVVTNIGSSTVNVGKANVKGYHVTRDKNGNIRDVNVTDNDIETEHFNTTTTKTITSETPKHSIHGNELVNITSDGIINASGEKTQISGSSYVKISSNDIVNIVNNKTEIVSKEQIVLTSNDSIQHTSKGEYSITSDSGIQHTSKGEYSITSDSGISNNTPTICYNNSNGELVSSIYSALEAINSNLESIRSAANSAKTNTNTSNTNTTTNNVDNNTPVTINSQDVTKYLSIIRSFLKG